MQRIRTLYKICRYSCHYHVTQCSTQMAKSKIQYTFECVYFYAQKKFAMLAEMYKLCECCQTNAQIDFIFFWNGQSSQTFHSGKRKTFNKTELGILYFIHVYIFQCNQIHTLSISMYCKVFAQLNWIEAIELHKCLFIFSCSFFALSISLSLCSLR